MVSFAIGVTLGVAVMTAAMTLYGALVVWVLWGWFIVPLGVPQIGIAWAIGIALVVQMLAPTPPPASEGKSADHLWAVALKPLFALAIGWIAKQFM